MICLVATVLACAAVAISVSYVPAPVGRPGDTAIEVVDAAGHASVVLFEGPPDMCAALGAAGVRNVTCDRSALLRTGMAVFVMPGGRAACGWMRGPDLMALGLPLPINAASAEDLEAIPGVGPALAVAIVADRVRLGPFGAARDLDRVRGIGPKKAAAIADYVTFEDARPDAEAR